MALFSPATTNSSCKTGPQLSGPPKVTIFGGGGVGALVNPIVSPISSSIIAFDIVDPGSGYLEDPFIAIEDPSGNGKGAAAKVNLGITTIVGVGTTSINLGITTIAGISTTSINIGITTITGISTTSINIGITTTTTLIENKIITTGITNPITKDIVKTTGGATEIVGDIVTTTGGKTTIIGDVVISTGQISISGGISRKTGTTTTITNGIISITGNITIIAGGTATTESTTFTIGNTTFTTGGTTNTGGKTTITQGKVITIRGNATNIGGNTSNIGGNTSNIGGNTSNIGGNTSNIGGNTSNIGGNTSNIGGNTTTISDNITTIGGTTIITGGATTITGETTTTGGTTTTTGGTTTILGSYATTENFGIKNITILSPGDGYLTGPDGSLCGNGFVWKEPDEGYVVTADGSHLVVQINRPVNVNPGDVYYPPTGSPREIMDPETITLNLEPVTPPIANVVGNPYQVVLSIEEVVVLDSGFGYRPEDKIIITPDNGAVLEPVINSIGQIESVKVISGGIGFDDIPEIKTNSSSGFNAQMNPIFKVTRLNENIALDIPKNAAIIDVIDCVGKF